MRPAGERQRSDDVDAPQQATLGRADQQVEESDQHGDDASHHSHVPDEHREPRRVGDRRSAGASDEREVLCPSDMPTEPHEGDARHGRDGDEKQRCRRGHLEH